MKHLIAALLAVFWASQALAQNQPPPEAPAEATTKWTVATHNAPPFSFRDPDGKWTGITIELMEAVAAERGLRLSWQEAGLDEMIQGVENGRFDAAAAAITVTPSRELAVDFSFPYYTTGLGIAVNTKANHGWFQVVRDFFSMRFLKAVAALAGVLCLAGVGAWIFERRGNEEQFSKRPVRGILDGFWWAAVTMTTVRYPRHSGS